MIRPKERRHRTGQDSRARLVSHPPDVSRRAFRAPILVNRPIAEFCVGSSDQRRPQPRSRRARSAGAPPSVSRRAAPQYIGRRCVVHAPTRVKQFPGRTWASLVHLQRTGPLVAAIYEWPPCSSRALIPAICFTTFSQGKGYCFIRVSRGNLAKQHPNR